MVERRRRKKNKLRGNRTHGGGNTKNRRGSGCRGGVGRAGSHKHKFSKYYVDFGTKIRLKAKPAGRTINLDDLTKLKNLKKEGEFLLLDGSELGYSKILGRGKVKEKVLVKNLTLSKNAREKIEAAGGKIEETAGETVETEEEFEEDKEETLEEEIKEGKE